MLKTLAISVLALSFCGTVSAKHEDKVYESGTLTADIIKTGGTTDTTYCQEEFATWHCDGGITEDEVLVNYLRLSDGTTLVRLGYERLSGAGILRANTCPSIGPSTRPPACSIKYRIERHSVFILRDNGKETKYNPS